ncbi:AAA family ATPase [Microbacterium marinilacus]|uniref:LuxR family transcriptional regulator n=1 Tax=Microbacterium marinilacus TaxID=415209 RepID=A0ABP7BGS6_9MICO|nr:AAA family ATPase [Microbacterium marinilacus]MBY0689610.1 AAA family ATPase [Microbacterium marinilacus]
MIGRDRELRRLIEVAARSGPDGRSVVLLEGVMGIGKTALLNVAASRLAVPVLREQGVDASAPLHAARNLVRHAHRRSPERLLEEGISVSDMASRCIRYLSEHPMTVVVDDVHAADDASVELLEQIVSSPAHGATMVLAHRPHRLPPSLVSAARRSGFPMHHILLGPLSDAEIREITRTGDEDTSDIVVQRSQGNPLFAHTLAMARRDGEDPVAWLGPPGDGWAVTLLDAVRSELDALPADARLCASAVAVLGTASARGVGVLTGLSDARLAAALHVLKQRRLLADLPDRIEQMHPVIRDAAQHVADPAWLVNAHRSAAGLRGELTMHERIEHLAFLGGHQTPKESDSVIRAAAPLIGTSPATVVRWLRSTTHLRDEGRDVLLARGLVLSGRPREAIDLLVPLTTHPQHRGESRQLLAHALRMLGRLEDASDVLARRSEEEDLPLRLERATLAIMHEARHPVDIDLPVDGDGGAAELAGRALRAMSMLNAGDVPDARHEFAGVADGLAALADEQLRDIVDTLAVAGWSAYVLDEFDDAIRLSRLGIRTAERHGRSHVLPHLRAVLAYSLIHRDRMREADDAARTAVVEAGRFSTPDIVPLALTARVLCAQWRGDVAAMRERMAELTRAVPSTVPWWRRTTESAVARIRASLEGGGAIPVQPEVLDATVAMRLLDRATIALINGDAARARGLVEEARAESVRTGLRSQRAFVGILDAEVALREGGDALQAANTATESA